MSDEKPPVAPAQVTVEEKLLQGGGEQIFFGGKSIAWYRAASWFAEQCFQSRMLPTHIKTKEQAFFILCKGEEIGLPPTAAWAFLYPTKSSNLGIMKKGALAAVQATPAFGGYEEQIEYEGTKELRATAAAWRKGFPPTVKHFSLKDAEVAGLLKRPKNRDTGQEYDGTYQAYLKDMLLSRAGCRALGVAFAAELAGCLVEGEAEDADEMAARSGKAPQIAATGAQAALQGPAQRLLAPAPPKDPLLLRLTAPAEEALVEAGRIVGLVPPSQAVQPLPLPTPEVQAEIDQSVDEAFPKRDVPLPLKFQAALDPAGAVLRTVLDGVCPRCATKLNDLGGCDSCSWPGAVDTR
jgi:hypothetical protein